MTPARHPCPICNGKGGELRDVVIDPRKNGEVGNVRKELIRCDACGGAGYFEGSRRR